MFRHRSFAGFLMLLASNAVAQTPEIYRKIETTCMSACHGGNLVAQQRLDRAGWTREIDKMIRWGAPVPAAEKDQWIEHLVSRFNNARPRPNSSKELPAGKAADLAKIACLGCHDDRPILQAGYDRAGWAASVDRMIGVGAHVPAARKAELIDYLASVFSHSK